MVTTFPIVITAASAEGIHLRQDDEPRFLGWDEIELIIVGTAMDGEERIFTMVFQIEAERIFVAFETLPVWRQLIETLPIGLPGIIPYELWSLGLRSAPSMTIPIYERRPRRGMMQ